MDTQKSLTFPRTVIDPVFTTANWQRNVQVFKQETASNVYWATAMAEEVGEVAGIVKKLYRGFNIREFKKLSTKLKQTPISILEKLYPNLIKDIHNLDYILHGRIMEQIWTETLRSKLAKELADVVTYADLMATRNQVSLGEAMVEKFNEVSDEMESPQFKLQ